jgi:hypothetical protein
MRSKTNVHSAQNATHRPFRLRVAAFDLRHNPTSFFATEYVRHQPVVAPLEVPINLAAQLFIK